MKIWNGLDSITHPLGPSSVAIGTFDGVHVGHRALIDIAVRDARANHRAAIVFTFDRRPADIIAPARAKGYLTTPGQREALIAARGVEHLVVAHFDQALRDMSPDSFLREVLAGPVGARTVMVGDGFRFGRNQAGGVDLLRESGTRHGFEVVVLPPVIVGDQKASSSRARHSVLSGDVAAAAAVLGRPFALAGAVVEGDRLGRTLGYPTANVEPGYPQVIPADGIYAVRVRFRGEVREGACSIGVRPTVGGRERRIEAFIFDFAGDLYGEEIEIAFVARLRDEVRFPSLEALVEQMGRDVADARRVLAGQHEREAGAGPPGHPQPATGEDH